MVDSRKGVSLPEDFYNECKKRAKLSYRNISNYIQYVIKEYWAVEEMQENVAKEK